MIPIDVNSVKKKKEKKKIFITWETHMIRKEALEKSLKLYRK